MTDFLSGVAEGLLFLYVIVVAALMLALVAPVALVLWVFEKYVRND